MSMILQSPGPIQLVIPDKDDEVSLYAAIRLAHSLDIYHKLDVNIMNAREASSLLENGSLGLSNIVVLGGKNSSFLKSILALAATPFCFYDGGLTLNGRQIAPESTAMFLHPHPASALGSVLVIYADSESALERAIRLFPIRTGIAVPDWVVLDDKADNLGAGGVQAAGLVLEHLLILSS
jgi:hypothetical protein